MTTSSLDKNQKIYITENSRLDLFNEILEAENNNEDTVFYFTADHLERHCLGKTYLPDYAYSHISKLLKKEYKEWKNEKIN